MKKFAIISGIISASMFVLGCVLCAIGIAAGGFRIIGDYAVDGVYYLMENFDLPLDFDNMYIEFSQDFDDENFTISFNEAYPIVQSGEYSEPQAALGENVTGIEIFVSAGTLNLQQSDSDDIGVAWEGLGKFQQYVENGTLYVISPDEYGEVTVTLPEKTYDIVKIAVSTGEIKADSINAAAAVVFLGACEADIANLKADQLLIESGACDLDIVTASVGELTMVYGASEINYLGEITGKADIVGSAGDIKLTLLEPDGFNYTVNASLGKVNVPGSHLAGNIHDQRIDNGAEKEISINSVLGNVTVVYAQQ